MLTKQKIDSNPNIANHRSSNTANSRNNTFMTNKKDGKEVRDETTIVTPVSTLSISNEEAFIFTNRTNKAPNDNANPNLNTNVRYNCNIIDTNRIDWEETCNDFDCYYNNPIDSFAFDTSKLAMLLCDESYFLSKMMEEIMQLVQHMNEYIDTYSDSIKHKIIISKTKNCRNELVSCLSFLQTFACTKIFNNNNNHNNITNNPNNNNNNNSANSCNRNNSSNNTHASSNNLNESSLIDIIDERIILPQTNDTNNTQTIANDAIIINESNWQSMANSSNANLNSNFNNSNMNSMSNNSNLNHNMNQVLFDSFFIFVFQTFWNLFYVCTILYFFRLV